MTLLRSSLFAVWIYGTIAIFGLTYLPASFIWPRLIPLAPRHWSMGVLWGLRFFCGVRVDVRGLENMPKGAALVASKHQSMLDTLVPFVVLNEPAFVMKQELMRLPVYSFFAGRGGHVPIDREGHAAAVRVMLKAAKAAVAAGRPVVIFPEGTRAEIGDPPDYKPGVAALYRSMNVPCVPVALNSGLCWRAKGVWVTPGVATIQFLPPIPAGLSREDFMARLEHDVENGSEALLPPDRRRAAAPLQTT